MKPFTYVRPADARAAIAAAGEERSIGRRAGRDRLIDGRRAGIAERQHQLLLPPAAASSRTAAVICG